ncbi:MAG: ABC transporter substrate-binding protein [Bacillota bacterium]
MVKMKTKMKLLIFILCWALLFIAGCGQKAVLENTKSTTSAENLANTQEATKPEDKSAASNTGLSSTGEKVVKIGLIAPLTGDFSAFGRHMENAFRLAVEERNYKTGDFIIRIVIADDQGDAGKADKEAAKLINEEKIHAIIGSFSYNCNIIISDIAQCSNIPMLTPTSPMPGITYHMGHRKDYIFCTDIGDYFHGTAAAGFALKNLKAKTAAILYNQDNEFGISNAERFKDEFENGGGKIQSFTAYSLKDKNFSTLLNDMANLKPDVIYFPDAYYMAGTIARQAQKNGIKATLYSGIVWDSDSIDPQALEGAYCTDHYSTDDPRPEVREFIKKYYHKYNSRPDAAAALTYDATQILLKAVETANSNNPVKINEAVQNIKDFPAVTGNMSFDHDGNPIKPAVILQVKGGKNIYFTSITPSPEI